MSRRCVDWDQDRPAQPTIHHLLGVDDVSIYSRNIFSARSRTFHVCVTYGRLQVSVGDIVIVHATQTLTDLKSDGPNVFFRQGRMCFEVVSEI